jgi:DNA-binding GntR family transcriptional regulator
MAIRSKRRSREENAAEDEMDIESAISERIKASILGGALAPGAKLTEESLSEIFGASRSRIRSVLQRLAFEDLVEIKRNRGAFIASPSVKDARGIFEARRVIERVTTEIATRTVLTIQLARLYELVKRQEEAWKQGDYRRGIRELGEFHLAMCALAHNQALTVVLERLIRRTSLILALYGLPNAMMRMPEMYSDLLTIVERGESLSAARAMERCLFALEKDLNFRGVFRPDAPLSDVIHAVAPD